MSLEPSGVVTVLSTFSYNDRLICDVSTSRLGARQVHVGDLLVDEVGALFRLAGVCMVNRKNPSPPDTMTCVLHPEAAGTSPVGVLRIHT